VANQFIIIRSAGERTEELCRKMILEQGINEKDIHMIHEVPFSKALKTSYELGIKSGKKWTFCVDADVLLRPGSIEKMIELAESAPKKVCQVQGYILDKFFGGIRRGGVHVYRTELLHKALTKIPDEGINVRPESFLLREMEKEGYPHKIEPYIVGTHDDEQYNFDIYRKAFVQAVKHTSRSELFIKHWKSNCINDHDFKVALKSFSDSIMSFDSVFINKNQSLYMDKFKSTGFEEKSEINLDSYSLDMIEKKIEEWTYTDIYFKYFPDRDGYDTKAFISSQKIKRNLRRFGLAKSVYLSLSKILIETGNKLKRKSQLI